MVDDGLYYTPHCGRESLRLFESWIGDTHKQFSKMLWYPFEMSNLTGSEHKREKSLGLCKSQERICVVYFPGESLTSRALCTKGSVLTLRQCTDSFFFFKVFFFKVTVYKELYLTGRQLNCKTMITEFTSFWKYGFRQWNNAGHTIT